MILSMTGFGRAQKVIGGRDVTVEIRSVNSRFFEYSSRMPRNCTFLDDKLKKLLNESISRGKVELSLQVQSVDAQDTAVEVNMEMAKGYLKAIREMSVTLGVPNDVTAMTLARMPDIFTVRKLEKDEEQFWLDVREVAQEALESFLAMRAAEGEKLRDDVLARLATLESYVTAVEENSAGRVQKYTEKLYARLKTVLEDRTVDDARVLTEAAIFADKTAVDEETVRLRSHIAQYRDMLGMNSPIGKKLDFLTQELNRETNTIGSKCSDVAITRVVVEMKGEIEKIREQIQNIE